MVNHFRFRPIARESSHSGSSSVTRITHTSVRCLCSVFCKRRPKWRENLSYRYFAWNSCLEWQIKIEGMIQLYWYMEYSALVRGGGGGKRRRTANIRRSIISVWHTSRVITSNVPRQRPSCPRTPASSRTSRRAVTAGSSSGSTPPPGTIQLSGLRLDVTNSTCKLKGIRERARDRARTSRPERGESGAVGRRFSERRERPAGTRVCRRGYRWLPSASWLTSSSRSLLTQMQAALRL